MSRFIKFIPSTEASSLRKKNIFAYVLLNVVAERASRTNNPSDGLGIGEAYLGDWDSYGMSRQNYRTALKFLVSRNFLKILETNRTRQKSTTGLTTEGTKVKLLNSDIWDINAEEDNHSTNHCLTTDQPLPNHEQEYKEVKNDKNKNLAQTAPPLRKKSSELISFSFDNRTFEGITDHDMTSWKGLYPDIDVDREIKRMVEWVLSNPAKAKKKWRSFITKWLNTNNEQAVDKKARRSFSSTLPGKSDKMPLWMAYKVDYKYNGYTFFHDGESLGFIPPDDSRDQKKHAVKFTAFNRDKDFELIVLHLRLPTPDGWVFSI